MNGLGYLINMLIFSRRLDEFQRRARHIPGFEEVQIKKSQISILATFFQSIGFTA
jgi:hypothetical protein